MAERPQSKFTRLTPAEFRQGLRRLEEDARREEATGPVPVAERYDVAVFAVP